jgi:hypothetical protein
MDQKTPTVSSRQNETRSGDKSSGTKIPYGGWRASQIRDRYPDGFQELRTKSHSSSSPGIKTRQGMKLATASSWTAKR